MDYIPEGLVVAANGFENTANPNVKKPTYGALGSMFVEFRVHKEYSGSESKLKKKEVYKPVEIVLIKSDKFSFTPKRITELSTKERIDLAPLYEQFKSQKDSNDTSIFQWQAVNDHERSYLSSQGVYSVEQLANYRDEELYRLGPGGVELRERAVRHQVTKNESKKESESELLKTLRAEKEALAAKNKQLEAALFAREEAKARKGKETT